MTRRCCCRRSATTARPLAAAKFAVSSAPKTSLSPREFTARRGRIEVHRPLTALVANLLDFIAVGCRRDSPQRRAYPRLVQRALVSIGKGATGFAIRHRPGQVDVGTPWRWPGRCFANLIDNALRYA